MSVTATSSLSFPCFDLHIQVPLLSRNPNDCFPATGIMGTAVGCLLLLLCGELSQRYSRHFWVLLMMLCINKSYYVLPSARHTMYATSSTSSPPLSNRPEAKNKLLCLTPLLMQSCNDCGFSPLPVASSTSSCSTSQAQAWARFLWFPGQGIENARQTWASPESILGESSMKSVNFVR